MRSIANFEQGSPAWVEWRRTRRMASEASVVTGRNPWQKPLQLAMVKRGLAETYMNSAMARGHQYEPEARAWLEAKLGLIGSPVVLSSGDYGASLDWWCKDDQRTIIGEIKIPSSPDAKLWTEGVVPGYYMDQVQQQLAVSAAEVCYFVIYLPEAQEGKVFEIYPDPYRWDEIRQAWDVFWETYMTGELKEEERNDQDWFEACERFRGIKAKAETINAELEACRSELIELAGEQPTKGCGIQVIRSEGKTTTKWAEVAKELKAPPELIAKYSSKSTKPSFTVKEI